MSQHRGQGLGAIVGRFDELHVEDGASLYFGHCLYEATHHDFVGEVNFGSWEQSQGVGHVGNVEVSGVLYRGSPCSDDGLDGGAVVVTYVASEEDKGGTETVLHRHELFKLRVVRVVDFAQPDIADANVQRVVVADASGERLLGTWGDWHDGGWLGLHR